MVGILAAFTTVASMFLILQGFSRNHRRAIFSCRRTAVASSAAQGRSLQNPPVVHEERILRGWDVFAAVTTIFVENGPAVFTQPPIEGRLVFCFSSERWTIGRGFTESRLPNHV